MGKKQSKEVQKEINYDDVVYYQTIISVILGIVFFLLLIFYILLESFQVTSVYVEGNVHYTAGEVREMVETGYFGDNSLYLAMKYSNQSITDIPFIEAMDVDVVNRNTIKITVYEKALAGYVEYLGSYMYFDKDGVIVESSSMRTAGIPLVTGLSFDHFVMYEPLPIEKEDIFQVVLNITQMLNKYEINTDKIHFDDDYEITLYFGNVRVDMGGTELLEEKIQRLHSILPQLEGRSGVLHMDTYGPGNEDITFTID